MNEQNESANTAAPVAGAGKIVSCGIGKDDMVKLLNFDGDSILNNLKSRFDADVIYTYIGTILLAVNPFKKLSVYGPEYLKEYRGVRIGQLPPHINAIADEAYTSLFSSTGQTGVNQAIVISGESGAGKTESTKHILQYLASLSGAHSVVEEQILQANPIMEAFGNSKTERNNNSSRFGKFIEIQFSTHGKIIGAGIREYLLEKSRIIHQPPGAVNVADWAMNDRNYHIFYMMCTFLSADLKKEFKLQDAKNYAYLNRVKDTVDLKEDYEQMIEAMDLMGLGGNTGHDIFKIVAAVLHIGNTMFAEEGSGVKVKDKAAIKHICSLLSVDDGELQSCLTTNVRHVRGEVISSPLTMDQAADARDSLSKMLYSQLFSWIIVQINKAITCSQPNNMFGSVGVLDIFGFEAFEVNRFEQFFINYANETLQQYFNHHIFKIEQDVYQSEGLPWNAVDFKDNQDCIDLIDKKPTGILYILDEESRFPKATDETALEKFHGGHAEHERYLKPSIRGTKFGINHYAGEVFYEVSGFLEKNRDILSLEMQVMLDNSTDDFLSKVYSFSPPDTSGSTSKKSAKTMASQFRVSLKQLMDTLRASNPFFVRCVKPNSKKVAKLFDNEMVLNQLEYTGVMETARIRSQGYGMRRPYEDFWATFSCLIPSATRADLDAVEGSKKVLETLPTDPDSRFALGKTLVFITHKLDTILVERRFDALNHNARIIQRNFKIMRLRNQKRRIAKAAIKLQSYFRMFVKRKQYLRARYLILRIQARARGVLAKKIYLKKLQEKRKEQTANKLKDLEVRLEVLKERRDIDQTEELAEVLEDEEKRLLEKQGSLKELLESDQTFVPIDHEEQLRKLWEQLENEKITAVEYSTKAGELVTTGCQILERDFKAGEIPEKAFELKKKRLEKYLTKLEHKDKEMARVENFAGLAASMFRPEAKLKHDKSPITTSCLRSVTGDNTAIAVEMFGLLLDIMKDSESPITSAEEEFEAVRKVISLGGTSRELCDELYYQICRQLVGNPVTKSAALGLTVLSLALNCLPPPQSLLETMIKMLMPKFDNDPEIAMRQLHTQGKAQNWARPSGSKTCVRLFPPCQIEHEAAKKMDTIRIPIMFSDGSSRSYEVGPRSLTSEIIRKIAADRNLTNWKGFSLCLVLTFHDPESDEDEGPTDFEVMVEPDELLLDVISQQHPMSMNSVCYFKKMHFLYEDFQTLQRNDTVATELIYSQCVSDFSQGKLLAQVHNVPRILALYKTITDNKEIKRKPTQKGTVKHKQFFTMKRVGKLKKKIFDKSKMDAMFLNALSAASGFKSRSELDKAVKKERSLIPNYSPAELTKSDLMWRFIEISSMCVPAFGYEFPGVVLVKDDPTFAGGPPERETVVCLNTAGLHYIIDGDANDGYNTIDFEEISKFSSRTRSDGVTKAWTVEMLDGTAICFHFQRSVARSLNSKLSFLLDYLRQNPTYAFVLENQVSVNDTLLNARVGDVVRLYQLDESKSWFYCFHPENNQYGFVRCSCLAALLSPVPASTKMIRKNTFFQAEVPGEDKIGGSSLVPGLLLLTEKKEGDDIYTNTAGLRRKRKQTAGITFSFLKRRGQKTERAEVESSTDELSSEERILFSTALIDEPLTRLRIEAPVIRDTFQAIMMWMRDFPRPRPEWADHSIIGHPLEFVLRVGIEHPELTDELYAQLCKQLLGNPDVDGSLGQGWIMLIAFLSFFPPSYTFEPYLMKYLREVETSQPSDPEYQYRHIARQCQRRMQMGKRAGARKCPPSKMEISCFEGESTAVFVSVKIRGAKPAVVPLPAGSPSTVKDIIIVACNQLGLNRTFEWGIFGVKNGTTTWISDDSYVLDACAKYDTLLFRKWLWLTTDEHMISESMTELYFYDLQRKFLLDFRDWSADDEVFELVAMQHYLASQKANPIPPCAWCGQDGTMWSTESPMLGFKSEECREAYEKSHGSEGTLLPSDQPFFKFVPKGARSAHSSRKWESEVDARVARLADSSATKYATMRLFIDKILSFKELRTSYFKVTNFRSPGRDSLSSVYFGINGENICFSTEKQNTMLDYFATTDLSRWRANLKDSHSDIHEISLKVGTSGGEVRSYTFHSAEGEEISSLISAYEGYAESARSGNNEERMGRERSGPQVSPFERSASKQALHRAFSLGQVASAATAK